MGIYLEIQKLLRDAVLVLLGAVQHGPELAHKDARVLPIQEPGQVDLHLTGVRLLNRREAACRRWYRFNHKNTAVLLTIISLQLFW